MPTLSESFRAPAYGQKQPVWERIASMLAFLFLPLLKCHHNELTRPYNNQQVCLECGCRRDYVYTLDGVLLGKWHTPIDIATRIKNGGGQ